MSITKIQIPKLNQARNVKMNLFWNLNIKRRLTDHAIQKGIALRFFGY